MSRTQGHIASGAPPPAHRAQHPAACGSSDTTRDDASAKSCHLHTAGALLLPPDPEGDFCLTPATILAYVVGPGNLDYVFDMVQQDGMLLEWVPQQLLTRTLVERAISSNGLALRVAPTAAQADKDLVLTAVLQDPFALAYASDHLKGNPDIVLAAAGRDPAVLQLASRALRGDSTFMLQAVALDATALTYASDCLLDSPAFRAAAAAANPLTVHYFVDTPHNPSLIPHHHGGEGPGTDPA